MINVSEIKEKFAQVISYSQGIETPDIDELFDQWLEAKRDIIEVWGGKLIVEVETPIQFHLDEKMRATNFGNFVSNISATYHNYHLAHFLNANQDSFFDNVVTSPYEYNGVKIPAGMKLVKAFKYFEKEKSILDTLQIQASQVIQEDKIEGTLCFSVHPLDFLSTSNNTYNWRSCHALDGEFRAGNLSYMLDKSTIICYLRGANDVALPLFPPEVPWNSKKWRVLFYLSESWNMIFASKQYPFNSKAGLDQVLPHLLKSLKIDYTTYTGWRDEYCDHYTLNNGREIWFDSPYLPLNHKLVPMDDIMKDAVDTPLHFNDVLHSSTYKKPYYATKEYFWWYGDEIPPRFSVGSRVKCLCCGDNPIKDSELMVCRSCAETYNLYDDDMAVCDCCGAHVHDDEYTCVQGEVVCGSCFEAECFLCEDCDEYYFKEDKIYDRERDIYVCVQCYNARKED